MELNTDKDFEKAVNLNNEDLTFNQWMDVIDWYCNKLWGLSCYDLPDQCYSDLYDEECEPSYVVEEYLAEEVGLMQEFIDAGHFEALLTDKHFMNQKGVK